VTRLNLAASHASRVQINQFDVGDALIDERDADISAPTREQRVDQSPVIGAIARRLNKDSPSDAENVVQARSGRQGGRRRRAESFSVPA